MIVVSRAGMCQRECTVFFKYLLDERERLQDLIEDFFDTKIAGHVPLSNCEDAFPPCVDFRHHWSHDPVTHHLQGSRSHGCLSVDAVPHTDVLDIYIDKKDRVWLIDVNPFGDPTTALLFTWEELLSASPETPQFRIVESDNDVLVSTKGSFRGPVDIHLSPDISNFMELCKKAKEDDDQYDSS